MGIITCVDAATSVTRSDSLVTSALSIRLLVPFFFRDLRFSVAAASDTSLNSISDPATEPSGISVEVGGESVGRDVVATDSAEPQRAGVDVDDTGFANLI